MVNTDENKILTGIKENQKSGDFQWTAFYQEIADKLLTFRSNRKELFEGIYRISEKFEILSGLKNELKSSSLQDICPFTAMKIFNIHRMDEENRKEIAQALAELLKVSKPVPNAFDGVPTLNKRRGELFFGSNSDEGRRPDDIDVLWEVFDQALTYSPDANEDNQQAFRTSFNEAIQIHGVSWMLTAVLFWIRPYIFPTLDENSKSYIKKQLNIEIGTKPNANNYLALKNELKEKFKEENFPVHSFPELSYQAYLLSKGNNKLNQSDSAPSNKSKNKIEITTSYSIENILADGCFLPKEQLEKILQRLHIKKNLILQGPPGTGKTWLAKRLAFALIGEKDAKTSKIRAVQFHPNLSYEDFVRGWRPSGDGKLTLVDGMFMDMIQTAHNDPSSKYVVVIEEINRGNPAQIFGEMLTLLEADKRTADEALTLSYQGEDGERIFIPKNLYIIGTMNIADRSLALVDLALRRRFAFINLMPSFNEAWEKWLKDCGIAERDIETIRARLTAINNQISQDPNLGTQFQIGHSYFTPSEKEKIADVYEWFEQIIESEISPLLDEYWFDSPDKAKEAKDLLKISV
ncbi:AAA family ATPase [Avibacterium paragallinarum]|uniref:AAA family ATPase n=1 Tax=Avibacterium paragallinarum TaxID=728 RepID=UPI002EDB767B